MSADLFYRLVFCLFSFLIVSLRHKGVYYNEVKFPWFLFVNALNPNSQDCVVSGVVLCCVVLSETGAC